MVQRLVVVWEASDKNFYLRAELDGVRVLDEHWRSLQVREARAVYAAVLALRDALDAPRFCAAGGR